MALFLITIAFVFNLLTSTPVAAQRLLAALLILIFVVSAGIDFQRRKNRRQWSRPRLLQAWILAGFLAYHTLKNASRWFYLMLENIAGGFSAMAGALLDRPLAMSVTYSGLDLVALFLIALAAALLLYRRASWKNGLLCLAAALMIWEFYLGMWTFLAENSLTWGLNRLEPLTGPLDYRILLFAMLLPAFLAVNKHLEQGAVTWRPGKIVVAAPPVLIALCLLTFLLPGLFQGAPEYAPGQNAARQVVFLDTGIDFSVPERDRYGLDQAGMFGILPHYLNQQGYRCLTVNELDEELLAATDVLVVINPMTSFTEATLSAIWRFVAAGGSCLAAGDHTGDAQVRLPLNALLRPVNIALNFDSAVPFLGLWGNTYRFGASPVLHKVLQRQAQIVVGASLSAGYQVRPLISGVNGYSDAGDFSNPDGQLGDMQFNRGERIGDLLLAAEAPYGEGKFMVFADTSLLQNTVLPYSYPLLDNIFAYLSEHSQGQGSEWRDDGFFRASCLIDASHLEVLSRDKSDNAADGLIACALRAGLLPRLNQNEPLADMLEKQGGAGYLVLIEPAIAFTAKELAAVERFMETGGTVILCAGYDSPEASQTLAGYWDFSFEAMPIGRIAPVQNPEMAFWDACPVLFQGDQVKAGGGADSGVRSLIDIWGYSTVVYRTIGDGGLYVIGDADFLKNKNLESVDSYRKGNVEFIDEILQGNH